MKVEDLKKKRAITRSSFTKTTKVVKEELQKTELDKGILNGKFFKLETLAKELKELNSDIQNLLIESNATEDDLIPDAEAAEEYLDEYITLRRLICDNLHCSSNTQIYDNTRYESEYKIKEKRYRLPKIEVKKFDGELINWLSFWAQFKKIHEDNELENPDKFHYLAQSMLSGTRACELIESYPLTSENYEKAISALKERFGKTELLTEIYVRELLKLMISNARSNGKDRLSLAKLFDKIESHLRALESIGLNQNSNAAWLYPMVESCLSTDILRAWQRSTLFKIGENKNNSRLSNLLEFLKLEVEGEERLKLARSGFDGSFSARDERARIKQNKNSPPTVAGLFTVKDQVCMFCGKGHESKECFAARSMSLKEKIDKLKELKCCLRCLTPGHIAKQCKRFVQCHMCKRAHYILLCPDLSSHNETASQEKAPVLVQNNISNALCRNEVALMTLEVVVKGKNKRRKVRALLDCGSQKSYILRSTAEALSLRSVSSESIIHTLFGGTTTGAKSHNKYVIKLSPVGKNIELEFELIDQEIICGKIPRLPKGPIWKELKKHKIWISDRGKDNPQIEILIGSDIYGKILTGAVKQLDSGLTAIETKLGWTVCGEFKDTFHGSRSFSIQTTSLSLHKFNVEDLWNLETIGITGDSHNISKAVENELAQEHFLNNLTRKEDGQYLVGLPWKQKYPPDIPSNRHIAETRLFSTTRKLRKLEKYEEYDKVFKEWLDEGVIEKVPASELPNACHYLPHHPVIKSESLTTKIRPVFDASCKTDRAPSLNECLFSGPNLIEQIPAILLRFRERAIAVTADIKRAFLQIELKREDRDFLRFLWWEKGKIQVFLHNRVVFGVTSSPYLLGAVITFHLSHVKNDHQHVSDKLMRSFYIDNCVTSVDDCNELKEFITKSSKILADAKMDLRMWEFGPRDEIGSEFLLEFPEADLDCSVPVLGLLWDKADDSLRINSRIDLNNSKPSKREILSITQGIYDPIGFLAPVLLPAKLLIQEAWTLKTEWDTPLPANISQNFLKWYSELETLTNIRIPRRVGFGSKNGWTVHVFCDASRNAYATVIYLRCEHEKRVSVQLLGAKSRLSPIKKITIPRLELLACFLGARLSVYILKALSLSDIPLYYWTDSSTALAWIQRNDEWGTFVGNRVREICKLTSPRRWFFVPGEMNAADLPSRGCSPHHLLKSRWWEGPDWLYKDAIQWPAIAGQTDEEGIKEERKKGFSLPSLVVDARSAEWYCKFSKFSKIVRILGWMKRFVGNSRKRTISRESLLSVTEIENAEKHLWQNIQQNSFGKIENECQGLMIIKDDDGLIRVKTKIIERNDEFSFRYPILLPSRNYLVICLIRELHLQSCHAGMQILSSKLREKYYIIASRRTIRSIINKCAVCKRFNAKACSTPPIHLPLDRVRDAACFEVVGVDLCGPLFLKTRSKVWIVLFTCAVYRAVHLELTSSLSTDAFLQALRRFIARRGRPSTIYTDNGTNFVGADSELKGLDWHRIELFTAGVKPFTWKFIPPTAAWWGGWWERLIRSVKSLLLRVLGNSSVKYEELMTILCDVEAQINSRPLTYISDSSCDLVPLTPSMFLQDIPVIGIPDLDKIDRRKLQIRLKYCQKLRDELRSRFRKEYLGQLVQKAGEKAHALKVGDVVLVGQDNVKRHLWHMARVEKIFPSRDGCSRVAQVKTKTGTLVRPLKKLYALEVSGEDPVVQAVPERYSRFGRRVRAPKRLNLLSKTVP